MTKKVGDKERDNDNFLSGGKEYLCIALVIGKSINWK